MLNKFNGVTVVMPCLNESETLGLCIKKARSYFTNKEFDWEIIVADNGSTDGSQLIAQSSGAKVVDVPIKGYGSAILAGIKNASYNCVIMGDSDDSYDFSKLDVFINSYKSGFQLIMGNRFLGGIEKGAMPWKNKYIGNPVLSTLGRILFAIDIKDFHCGIRCFDKNSMLSLGLKTTGMEFASEMVIKSKLASLNICEVPTTLSKDGRSRPPHLRPWRDGWRHLRFMLLYSPKFVFRYSSYLLLSVSVPLYTYMLVKPITVSGIQLSTNTLGYLQLMIFIGAVLKWFDKFIASAKTSANNETRNVFSLEMGLLGGVLSALIGFALTFYALTRWESLNFGEIDNYYLYPLVNLSITFMFLGVFIFFASLANVIIASDD